MRSVEILEQPGPVGPEPVLNVLNTDTACVSGGARIDGVTVSVSPESPYFVDAYPAGVGRIVAGGSLIGINRYYYNEPPMPEPAAHFFMSFASGVRIQPFFTARFSDLL